MQYTHIWQWAVGESVVAIHSHGNQAIRGTARPACTVPHTMAREGKVRTPLILQDIQKQIKRQKASGLALNKESRRQIWHINRYNSYQTEIYDIIELHHPIRWPLAKYCYLN